MTNKKIFIIITRLILGGAQNIVLNSAVYLKNKGYDVKICAGYAEKECGNIEHKFAEHNIPIIRIKNLIRNINPIKDILCLTELFRILIKEKPDIVHLHTSKAGFIGAIAARAAGISKIIYTPHGHIFAKNSNIPGVSQNFITRRILLFIRRTAHRFSDITTALSQTDMNEQLTLKLAPQNKYRIVPNGIEFSKFENIKKLEIKKKLDLINNFPIIAITARLTEEKGHKILFDATVLLKKKFPDFKLLVFGDGSYKNELIAYSDSLNLTENIIFYGLIPDIENYLPVADIFALPSHYESFGLAVIEAMYCKIPVIASNVAGLAELIEHNKTGFLFQPANSVELADFLIKISENINDYKNIIDNTFIKVKENYSDKLMNKKFIKIYNE